jgi:hypothetical protein
VLDWSKSVQASSVQVQKKWGLVRSRSKNYSDWIGLDLDGPGLDWSNAGLVESFDIPSKIRLAIFEAEVYGLSIAGSPLE